jgi:hypothetical protein
MRSPSKDPSSESPKLTSRFLPDDVLRKIYDALSNGDDLGAERTAIATFLAAKGIPIPAGVNITILQAPRAAPPGLENLIPPLPSAACPPGTTPTRISTTVRVCAEPFEIRIYNPNPQEGEAPYEVFWGCRRFEDRVEDRWYCQPVQP